MPHSPDSPLRVLHYLDAVREEAGGVVRCVIDLCGVLAAAGTEVTLATLDARDVPPAWTAGDGRVPAVLPMAGHRRAFAEAMADADVVHLHTPWDRRNAQFARALVAHRVPYVVSVHGMLDDWCMEQKTLKKRLYLWLAGRRLLERAYRVHCTAEGEAQQASRWYPRGRSVVLPLVVDLPDVDRLPGAALARQKFPMLGTPAAKVLFLSRLHPKKGVENLLRATRHALDHGTDITLLVAGPGEPAYVGKLQRLAGELGIADRTHWLGLVQGEAKLSLYQACDLLVLPTHQENFGLVLPEALACGTPVVTTRGVDIWPEIEEAGGAIVDNRADVLGDRIAELVADRPALERLGQQGREYIYHWLDPQRVVAGYQQLYREAAASSAPLRTS